MERTGSSNLWGTAHLLTRECRRCQLEFLAQDTQGREQRRRLTGRQEALEARDLIKRRCRTGDSGAVAPVDQVECAQLGSADGLKLSYGADSGGDM